MSWSKLIMGLRAGGSLSGKVGGAIQPWRTASASSASASSRPRPPRGGMISATTRSRSGTKTVSPFAARRTYSLSLFLRTFNPTARIPRKVASRRYFFNRLSSVPPLPPRPRLVLGSPLETTASRVRAIWRKSDGDGQEDCGGVHGRGRRLCRRAYGPGRRGRDLYRFLARARRAHETARADDHPPARCRAVHRAGTRVARHRAAAFEQGKADRHRLRLHQILRYGVGDDDDQAVSGARRLCRLAAELHERGDDRRGGRLGQDLGLDRQLDHGRAARAGSDQARRGQVRFEARTVSSWSTRRTGWWWAS